MSQRNSIVNVYNFPLHTYCTHTYAGPNSHDIVADGKQLYSFPAANPGGIQAESLSNNPKDKNFFAIAVVKSTSGKEKCRF